MKKLTALAFALLLTACANAPAIPEPPPAISSAPIRLNVAEVRVLQTYQPSHIPPHVEQAFPTPPALAVDRWVRDHLIASGRAGVLEVSVDDASVFETVLPKKTGIAGYFTTEQDRRFDANLKVTMRLYDGRQGMSAANAEITVTRMQTLGEKATRADREQLFNTMLQFMMAQFDQEANAKLRQYFSAYMM